MTAQGPKAPGPTFPSLTPSSKTGEWHMLAHDDAVPSVSALPADYHRLTVPHEHGAQHNPTVIGIQGKLHVVVRVLHGAHTTNYLAQVKKDWTLGDVRKITSRVASGQLEDLRLFQWRDRLWAVAATHHNVTAIRQALLEFSEDGSEVLKVHVQPSDRHEKNWMPCVRNDSDLRLVYSTDPLTVLRVADRLDGYFAVPSAKTIPQVTGHVRGGSQLIPWGDGWLAVVHHVYKISPVPAGHNPLISSFWPAPVVDPVAGSAKVVYLHRFAWYSHDLSKVKLGKPFYFRKIGIEFCAGLSYLWVENIKTYTKLALAFGVADKEAWLAVVDTKAVEALFD